MSEHDEAQERQLMQASQRKKRGYRPGGPAGRMIVTEKPRDFKGTVGKLVRFLGRFKFAMLAALVFAMAYWWLCAVVIVGIDVVICGAEGWSLPVQVVFGFDNPYPLTVGQTMLAVYGLGYLVALGMAALTLLLSSKMRSTMPVAVVPMAIVFLGMFALFITPLAKAGSLTPMAGMNYAFSHMASYAAGTAAIDLLRTPDASLQRRGLGFRFPPLGPRSTANRVTSREDSPRIPPRDYLQNR